MLKTTRLGKGLTQDAAAKLLGIGRRSLARYEKDETLLSPQRLAFYVETLRMSDRIDETHGILTISDIRDKTNDIFASFGVEYAYLFGSYAKGRATEQSDVDLFVSMPAAGIRFFELIEALREALHKKVDLVELTQLKNNFDLIKEIMHDGVKIYG